MRGKTRRTGGTNPHWSVVEIPEVKVIARKIARHIASMNQGVFDEDDLYQDALVIAAATPHIADLAICREFGLVFARLRTEMLQRYVEKLQRSGELNARKYKTVVIEDREDDLSPYIAFDAGSGDYTDDAIRLLLPAVWDESYAYGLPLADDTPDHDMPKSAANKSQGNSHWAFIADVKIGWRRAPLTLKERRSTFLRFGPCWTQAEIALHEGIDQSTVKRRIDSAVTKITASLNGASIVEEELVA